MIKKVHFVQLLLLILLLFVLFQITSISISFDEFKSSFENSNDNIAVDVTNGGMNIVNDGAGSILLITGENSTVASHIQQELNYLHRSYQIHESLLTLSEEDFDNVEIVILASSVMKDIYDLQTVQSIMNKGIHVIMAVIPDNELEEQWHSFLGIDSIRGSINQEGISIYSGFFLEEKYDYEELKMTIKDVRVSSTCKTYIAGIPSSKDSDSDYKNMPDILWRNVNQGSHIYVVNGPFFTEGMSIGIISGIFSQIYEDYIYPIINAKALLINNAPYLSIENDKEMHKRYARNSQRFLEDIVVPNIIALSMTSGIAPTFYGTTTLKDNTLTENNLNSSILTIVDNELKRIGGEIGVSTYSRDDSFSTEKVRNNISIYKKELDNYDLNSLIINKGTSQEDLLVDKFNDMTDIYSLVSAWEDGTSFSYYNSDTVNIPMITQGYSYTDEDLLKLHSTVSTLGVITHGIDISKIIYPESENEDWTNAFDDLSSAISTYWKDYSYIDGLNMSGVSSRVIRFLNMKPSITTLNNRISINIDNFDEEAFFILRTAKEVIKIDNGTVTKIHNNAYLVSANDKNVEITIEE